MLKFLCIIWSSGHFLTHILMHYTYGHTHVKWSVSLSFMPDSLQPHGLQPIRLLSPWDFPGKDTGVGCYFLLLGIFLTQGPNSCLLHGQLSSLLLSQQGSPAKKYNASQTWHSAYIVCEIIPKLPKSKVPVKGWVQKVLSRGYREWALLNLMTRLALL